MAADDVAVVPRHYFPEEAGGVRIGRIARQLVQAAKADQLRDLGVGVDPGENVLALAQRVQNLLVAQALGQAQPASVEGAGGKLRSEEQTYELQAQMSQSSS